MLFVSIDFNAGNIAIQTAMIIDVDFLPRYNP